MGYRRVGYERIQALLEGLKRRLDLNGSIFSDLYVDYFNAFF